MEIKEPKIPEETKKEMAKFFWKTSIPRILAEIEKKEEMMRTSK
jgi:hypothetical protein